MIARVWHGLTREADAAAYLWHVETKGFPSYRNALGNRGALVLRRLSNGVAEFLVISFWESWDAIRSFVGSDDVNQAIYFPEDRAYLLCPEPEVKHYETLCTLSVLNLFENGGSTIGPSSQE